MNQALVYLAAAGFALSVFPFHIYNYIYINTAQKYAAVNVGLYGKINFFNINNVKNSPMEMQVNGKNKQLNMVKLRADAYKIFNCLCIYKIVQLTDFGMKSDANAYIALLHSGLTCALYKFIQCNGNYSKLRYYTLMNASHRSIVYYAKTVTIINAFVIGKIILILIMEKFK